MSGQTTNYNHLVILVGTSNYRTGGPNLVTDSESPHHLAFMATYEVGLTSNFKLFGPPTFVAYSFHGQILRSLGEFQF